MTDVLIRNRSKGKPERRGAGPEGHWGKGAWRGGQRWRLSLRSHREILEPPEAGRSKEGFSLKASTGDSRTVRMFLLF